MPQVALVAVLIVRALSRDVSAPLRDAAPAVSPAMIFDHEEPAISMPIFTIVAHDLLVGAAPSRAAPAPLLSFEGEGAGIPGAGWSSPADANGAVGPNHVVEVANGTFWHTGGYAAQGGAGSRISAFRLPGYGESNDFTISLQPAAAVVDPGGSASFEVHTAEMSGTAERIALSIEGLPPEFTGQFTPDAIAAGGTSTLTIGCAANAASGNLQFAVRGVSTSAAHSASATLMVAAAAPDAGDRLTPLDPVREPAGGCASTGGSWLASLVALLAVTRRRDGRRAPPTEPPKAPARGGRAARAG